MEREAEQTDDLEKRIQRRVGARVRELRQAAGITAAVLAGRAGLSQGLLDSDTTAAVDAAASHLKRGSQAS